MARSEQLDALIAELLVERYAPIHRAVTPEPLVRPEFWGSGTNVGGEVIHLDIERRRRASDGSAAASGSTSTASEATA